MPGLVPGTHVLATLKEDVDGRVKPAMATLTSTSLSLTRNPA